MFRRVKDFMSDFLEMNIDEITEKELQCMVLFLYPNQKKMKLDLLGEEEKIVFRKVFKDNTQDLRVLFWQNNMMKKIMTKIRDKVYYRDYFGDEEIREPSILKTFCLISLEG